MRINDSKIADGARIILFKCGNLKKGEKVCIVSEPGTKDVGRILHEVASARNIRAEHAVIDPLKTHGQEPPKELISRMIKSDIVIGITKLSMAHTEARYKINRMGVRYLSLPDYSIGMLKNPALRIDFKKSARRANHLAGLFTKARTVNVCTKNGTKITMDVTRRNGNFCPGYVDRLYKMGSPPDIESNIAPIEDQSCGIIAVDASIAHPQFGKLKSPVYLTIKKGKIIDITGDAFYIKKLNRIFSDYGDKSRILAEFGVGFNEKAKVCGNMLLDEGAYGTAHVGFGSNSTIGGMNKINFHLDFVFYVDQIILDGRICRIRK